MTRRRKKLLVALALVLLAVGGLAWYGQATAVDRQVSALLAEVREEKPKPGLVERWLIKLRLWKHRRPGRAWEEVADDLAKLGPSAVPALIRALRDRDRDRAVRSAAARALGILGDARAVEPLIAVLRDEDWAVRSAAARALGILGDARGAEPLIAVLEDEDEDATVRLWVAQALGYLGDARGVEPLITALKDESEDVRAHAAWALGDLGDARGVKPLKKLLGDKSECVHEAATRALAQLHKLSEGKP